MRIQGAARLLFSVELSDAIATWVVMVTPQARKIYRAAFATNGRGKGHMRTAGRQGVVQGGGAALSLTVPNTPFVMVLRAIPENISSRGRGANSYGGQYRSEGNGRTG